MGLEWKERPGWRCFALTRKEVENFPGDPRERELLLRDIARRNRVDYPIGPIEIAEDYEHGIFWISGHELTAEPSA